MANPESPAVRSSPINAARNSLTRSGRSHMNGIGLRGNARARADPFKFETLAPVTLDRPLGYLPKEGLRGLSLCRAQATGQRLYFLVAGKRRRHSTCYGARHWCP